MARRPLLPGSRCSRATQPLRWGSSFKMEGTVYMPNGNLQYTGGSSTSADCLFLVANRVSFTGSSTIRNSCPPGVDDEFAAIFIRLIE